MHVSFSRFFFVILHEYSKSGKLKGVPAFFFLVFFFAIIFFFPPLWAPLTCSMFGRETVRKKK